MDIFLPTSCSDTSILALVHYKWLTIAHVLFYFHLVEITWRHTCNPGIKLAFIFVEIDLPRITYFNDVFFSICIINSFIRTKIAVEVWKCRQNQICVFSSTLKCLWNATAITIRRGGFGNIAIELWFFRKTYRGTAEQIAEFCWSETTSCKSHVFTRSPGPSAGGAYFRTSVITLMKFWMIATWKRRVPLFTVTTPRAFPASPTPAPSTLPVISYCSAWRNANTMWNETLNCFVFLLLEHQPLLYYVKFALFFISSSRSCVACQTRDIRWLHFRQQSTSN